VCVRKLRFFPLLTTISDTNLTHQKHVNFGIGKRADKAHDRILAIYSLKDFIRFVTIFIQPKTVDRLHARVMAAITFPACSLTSTLLPLKPYSYQHFRTSQ
jgi:hypothetical protein